MRILKRIALVQGLKKFYSKGKFMKRILLATIVALTTAFAGGDIAPTQTLVEIVPTKNFYVGGGISAHTTYKDGEKDFFNDTDESEISGGIEAKLGYIFYRTGDASMAIEGQIERTIWGMDIEDVDYIYSYGLYIKPAYDITTDITGYILLGYGRTEVEFNVDDSYGESGFTYGIGAEYSLNDEWGLYGEYVISP